jgi:hypothetical protein
MPEKTPSRDHSRLDGARQVLRWTRKTCRTRKGRRRSTCSMPEVRSAVARSPRALCLESMTRLRVSPRCQWSPVQSCPFTISHTTGSRPTWEPVPLGGNEDVHHVKPGLLLRAHLRNGFFSAAQTAPIQPCPGLQNRSRPAAPRPRHSPPAWQHSSSAWSPPWSPAGEASTRPPHLRRPGAPCTRSRTS